MSAETGAKRTMSWIKITNVENIPVREGRAVTLGDRQIAVFNLGDRFAAIDNECPHNGGPLCDGIVSGTVVVCPLHGWKIDLGSGAVQQPQVPVCVETFPVRVEAGIIQIEFDAPAKAKEEAA